jgi:hypothetical protein
MFDSFSKNVRYILMNVLPLFNNTTLRQLYQETNQMSLSQDIKL